MTVYAGFDVLEIEPCRDSRDDTFARGMATLASRTGRTKLDARTTAPAVRRPFHWIAQTRAESTAMRTFLLARLGKAVPFWCPTWDADLVPTADITAAATSITIQSCSYASLLFSHLPRRRLAIMSPSGAKVYRKVLTATDNGDGTETLTLDSAIGVTIAKDVAILSFLPLYRLADDGVDIHWHSVTVCEGTLGLVEIPNEVPA